jgi:hypothetical protein
MLFLLGILGITQTTLLPGLIFLKIIKYRASFLERMVYTFSLSLILNYCLVLILVLIRLYFQPVVAAVAVVEMIAILWLYRRELNMPILARLSSFWNELAESASSFFPIIPEAKPDQNSTARFRPLLLIVLAVVSLVNIWSILKIFIYNLGTVFNAWDVVVSWNRWAATWAGNEFPFGSHFYPQLIPVTWSSIYVSQGTMDIQFFAKAIMPLFPLMLFLLFFNLGSKYKQLLYFIALIISQLLLKKYLVQEFTNGYVDLAVAFYGFLPAHAILVARQEEKIEQRNLYILLGAIFAVGASLTKQSGLYILAFYPLLVYFGVFYPAKLREMGVLLWKWLASYAALALIPIGWYVFRVILFNLGLDRAETSGLIQETSANFHNIGFFGQIINAFAAFDKYIFLFLIVLVAIPFVDPFYRALILLIVIPYPLLWAWGAAYDTRNLALFFPYFSLASAAGFHALIEFLLNRFDRLGVHKIQIYWAGIVVLVALAAGAYAFSNDRLQNNQMQKELQSYSPAINAKISAIIKQNGPQTKILTNYPVRYLPGFEQNQIQFSFRDYNRFLQFTTDPGIRYMLIPSNMLDAQVEKYVNEKIASGSYRVLLVDKSWVKYTLLEVVNR